MDDRQAKRAKPSAPKKSVFERHKDEVEAKRARDQADADAALDDFAKYFDVDTPKDAPQSFGGNTRPPRPNVPGQRHFANNAFRSSGPGTLQQSSSEYSSRKRNHEGFVPQHSRHSAPEQHKPSLLMTSLPPGTSTSFVKSLIPSLRVDNVKIFPPERSHPTDKKSVSAIVSLASDSSTADLDSASSALQNKYLGRGYHLSVSRHLSSTSIKSTLDLHSTPSLPFGAKETQSGYGASRVPTRHGGFAPPASYGPNLTRRGPSSQVDVKIPEDIKQVQIIHKTIENVLKYGAEFEALLMSRSEIKTNEKWAWLYDARSAEGVYYRWRLHQTVTNSGAHFSRARGRTSSTIFAGEADWLSPENYLEYEFTTDIAEFISDKDYDSSDEDDLDGEESRPKFGGAPQKGDGANEHNQWIGPLGKAKLTHLLARLPTSQARLRRGDVARITAFAIEHAQYGAAEIVNMILLNLRSPLAFTSANPNRAEKSDNDSVKDISPAKLVGLYVISDIISSCATSGIRHAWRYRTLFEAAIRENKVFEHLGRLSKDLKWGRLKSENWKRSVQGILRMWDDSSAFTHINHEYFVQTFNKPPLTEEELHELEEAKKAAALDKSLSNTKGRWITSGFKPATGRLAIVHAGVSYNGGLLIEGSDGISVSTQDIGIDLDCAPC
ncbi:hypothetical protein N7495_008126 [Penicillium taxi]|uniref:uncharacterized protein n=1 Tax=Penicillium taxi TaxID=168475 RepID=UPI002545B4BF|nr:uncharacterized protein N7495_008126 [Penicillium taxi]KAJ5888085.1 hypothetical protein N7495_008126 [Penicillium taxi]